jgi:predicted phage terminase large subunit-like protein
MTTVAEPSQSETLQFGPASDPQRMFAATAADIAIYGGAAYSGKTWQLLLEPLRYFQVPGFAAVFFRRTMGEVTAEGQAWDSSKRIYPYFGGESWESDRSWTFPEYGTAISFGSLQHDKDVKKWFGSQIPLILIDELTTFSAEQFWGLVARNRNPIPNGVKPYLRAGCNPDPDSFVSEFIRWWINQETGYPIPERAGVLRWFVREGDSLLWADSREELETPDRLAQGVRATSVTFVPARAEDNVPGLEADPTQIANLMRLPTLERERLRYGNWKIRSGGRLFQREWFKVVPYPPSNAVYCRYWDNAATKDDGAFTAGVLAAKDALGRFYICDVSRGQWSASERRVNVKNRAVQDNQLRYTVQLVEQEPGSSGKEVGEDFVKALFPLEAHAVHVTGDKELRARPTAAQAEIGNVYIVAGEWNENYLAEIALFPKGRYKDQMDATSGALNWLAAQSFSGEAGIYVPEEYGNALDEIPEEAFK